MWLLVVRNVWYSVWLMLLVVFVMRVVCVMLVFGVGL